MNSIFAPRPFTLATRSVLVTSLTCYALSKGLWLLLLGGLIGARFWLPRDDGTSVIIAINDHLPQLTSPMIRLSLGTVLSTLLLPFGFLYLRANVNRQQPCERSQSHRTSSTQNTAASLTNQHLCTSEQDFLSRSLLHFTASTVPPSFRT